MSPVLQVPHQRGSTLEWLLGVIERREEKEFTSLWPHHWKAFISTLFFYYLFKNVFDGYIWYRKHIYRSTNLKMKNQLRNRALSVLMRITTCMVVGTSQWKCFLHRRFWHRFLADLDHSCETSCILKKQILKELRGAS